MSLMDSFRRLGLFPDATTREIKDAYRALALAAHPDAGGDVAAFAELHEAYRAALEFARYVPCGKCQGRGELRLVRPDYTITTKTCDACKGSGRRDA